MSIDEIVNGKAQDFDSVTNCSACGATEGNGSFHLVYCESAHARGITNMGHTPFLDTTKFGDNRSPHLHVTCPRCQFTWIELPAWTK